MSKLKEQVDKKQEHTHMIIYEIYMRLYNDLDNRINLDVLYPWTHTQIHIHVFPSRGYIFLIYAHKTIEKQTNNENKSCIWMPRKPPKVEIL